MNKIYEQSKDQHIRNYVVYTQSGKTNLYTDAACTAGNELNKEQLVDIFNKGFVIAVGTKYYTPVALDAASAKATVTYLGGASNAAETRESKEKA